jgi:hypothetical protein
VALLSGALGAVVAARDMRQVTAPHPGFEQAFGVAWERAIAPEQQSRMLQRRWSWHLPANWRKPIQLALDLLTEFTDHLQAARS